MPKIKDDVSIMMTDPSLPGSAKFPAVLITPAGDIPITKEELLRLKYLSVTALSYLEDNRTKKELAA